MKKKILILLLLVVFTMTGCTNTVIDDPLACEEGEMLIGEDCKVLSGAEIQLYNAINNTHNIVAYDMDVSISNETEMVELNIAVKDDETSIVIDHERSITYTSSDGICEVVEVYLDTEMNHTENCNETDRYAFFTEFDYTWFVLESGKYKLVEGHYETVEELFDGFLENAEIIDFQTSVQNGYISEVTLVIEINAIEYTVEMVISNLLVVQLTQVTGDE